MANAVHIIETSFRELLGLNADEPGGILPMRAPTEDEPEEELALTTTA